MNNNLFILHTESFPLSQGKLSIVTRKTFSLKWKTFILHSHKCPRAVSHRLIPEFNLMYELINKTVFLVHSFSMLCATYHHYIVHAKMFSNRKTLIYPLFIMVNINRVNKLNILFITHQGVTISITTMQTAKQIAWPKFKL